MKKNFVYAMMSAIVLSGAVSFSACSSSDELTDVNPTFDGKAVKTQFTISVTGKAGKSTRMAASTVQEPGEAFRGLDQIVLIPYGAVASDNVSGNRLGAGITLNVSEGTANTLPSFYKTESNSYVYSDVEIPVGTYGFLFYGKAKDVTAGTLITAAADKFTYGYLTPSALTGEKETFSFSLNPMKDESNSTATALLAYVNAVANAHTTADTPEYWYNAANEGIRNLYTKFVTMKAGSSTSIREALEDLYESVKGNSDAMSAAIRTAILTKATWNETNKELTLDSSVDGYPGNINLPDGAVALKWTIPAEPTSAVATAAWQTAESTVGDGTNWNTGTANFTSLDKYVFPASLYYRADSPVLVSKSKQSDNYLTKTWAEITNTTSGLYKDGSYVDNSTQSVAIVEQIQYAVAQLESTVNIAAATLKDKNGDNVKIGSTNEDDGTFKVTGILIGGQRNVDWQFLPVTTGDPAPTIYTIYDREVPSSNVITGTSSSIKNYTLALESPENEAVYVAIEFENNAKDFMGKDGLVAKGAKFYLVGQLDPANATNKGTGEGKVDLSQVFKQDYKTTVTFTIRENVGSGEPATYPDGLGAAYNVIPDLRTPQKELGLSVNLEWQTGLNFNVTF